MRCIYCGYETDNEPVCRICGGDLSTYRRILAASDACYNEGLKKAEIRDLSGALAMLRRSLKYNKNNVPARNLLGLIYFETGDYADALYEWVISKNIMPYDNRADYYLEQMSGNSGILNRIDSITKKYNQALVNAKQGDYDLAKISLKRIISENPKMLRARSLLALIDYNEKNYKSALKQLKYIWQIDRGNSEINTYIREIETIISSGKSSSKKRKKDEEYEISAQNYTQTSAILDYSKTTFLNIVIGLIIGLMVGIFLIFPVIKQYENDDALRAFLTANEDIRSNENEISSKQEQIDALNEVLEKYEGQADVKTSYENLLLAQEAYQSRDYDMALSYFDNVTRDIMNQAGVAQYDSMEPTMHSYRLTSLYTQAKAATEEENYASAIELYTILIGYDENYDNGNALFNLAQSYENAGDTKKALDYYNHIIEIYEGRNLARRAGDRVAELSAQEGE